MRYRLRNFKINKIDVCSMTPPYCIAEVGINHNGDLSLAKKMVEIAKKSGADAVKFQTFKAEEFCGDLNQLYSYRSQGVTVTESMYEMFKRYEFNRDDWIEISQYCAKVGITFMSTPQNVTDLNILLELGISAIKIGSDDFTNLPLIREYAQKKLPMILSCGMSNLAEVHDALDAAGWYDGSEIAILLCTSQYPTPLSDVHLSKLITLQNAFPGLVTGLSDHTQGSLAAGMAVALGARIFEKHFTLDHHLPGPDHWFSEDPSGLGDWVNTIKSAYEVVGSPYVKPTLKEQNNKQEFQRRIVAIKEIDKDELFDEHSIGLRRVAGGRGLPPKFMDYLIGRKAFRAFRAGEPIEI